MDRVYGFFAVTGWVWAVIVLIFLLIKKPVEATPAPPAEALNDPNEKQS